MRVMTQPVGQAWRIAHDLRHDVEQRRIGVEKREELHARRQPPEKFVESREGGVGIGGLGEGFQEAWHQLRQQLPRPFAAHRAVPAVMPVADHAGYGPAVAERSEEHTSELQSLMRNSYAVFC